MRLDKFLKVSRLIKRRTVANEACDNGRISVNGRVVKASYDVKVGDKIEISMGPALLRWKFWRLPTMSARTMLPACTKKYKNEGSVLLPSFFPFQSAA